jgi:hypothetical protein
MANVIHSPEIHKRGDFALLCNARGVKVAVEVGVEQGVFACEFLSRWAGTDLWLVDPYEPYPEVPWDRRADLQVAVTALAARHHGRFRFILSPSVEAARQLPYWARPGFVYLDGDHTLDAVKADIAAWWPRLYDGGILAGHDFARTHPGVKRAVEAFAEAHGLTVFLTEEPLASWYVYKGFCPEPIVVTRR